MLTSKSTLEPAATLTQAEAATFRDACMSCDTTRARKRRCVHESRKTHAEHAGDSLDDEVSLLVVDAL